jgi:hypothetical protein
MKGAEFINVLTKQVTVVVAVFGCNAKLICNLPPPLQYFEYARTTSFHILSSSSFIGHPASTVHRPT